MKSLFEKLIDGVSADGRAFLAVLLIFAPTVLIFAAGAGLFTSINEAQVTKQMELTNEAKRLDIELIQLKGVSNEHGEGTTSGTDRGSSSSVKLEDRTQGP